MLEFITKYWLEWAFTIITGALTTTTRYIYKRLKHYIKEVEDMRHEITALQHTVEQQQQILSELMAALANSKQMQDTLIFGMRSLLRDNIISAYNKYVHERGECPIYAREHIENMYSAYEEYGESETIKNLLEEIRRLPTEKEQPTDAKTIRSKK